MTKNRKKFDIREEYYVRSHCPAAWQIFILGRSAIKCCTGRRLGEQAHTTSSWASGVGRAAYRTAAATLVFVNASMPGPLCYATPLSLIPDISYTVHPYC